MNALDFSNHRPVLPSESNAIALPVAATNATARIQRKSALTLLLPIAHLQVSQVPVTIDS